jgi:flagellar protein FliS
VLLYQGAIRFGTLHLVALERGDRQAAHDASLRAQAIVGGLQEVLDLSAGPIAAQLDSLYTFVLRRFRDGNMTSDAGPTTEALQVLRGLLEAWQEAARPTGYAAHAANIADCARTGSPVLAASSPAHPQSLLVGGAA